MMAPSVPVVEVHGKVEGIDDQGHRQALEFDLGAYFGIACSQDARMGESFSGRCQGSEEGGA